MCRIDINVGYFRVLTIYTGGRNIYSFYSLEYKTNYKGDYINRY